MARTPEEYMARAFALAQKGFPAPNPHVGCVIVRNGHIVGEGYHDHAGSDHAEVVALKSAGDLARGSDVFVTQEPCNHFGRTPPCSRALVQAGVQRVFIAVPDPNPTAQGGIESLRQHGIEVEVGLGAEAVEAFNWLYLGAVRSGRVRVTAKAAVTLDGFMARPDGSSKWITGARARRDGHRLRAQMGAVLVGRQTVVKDDPELTARIPGVVNQPVRVVLDPAARLSGRERVFNDRAETLWIVAEGCRTNQDQLEIPARGGLDLEILLTKMRERGLIGVLIEGGPRTLQAFLQAHLVDRLVKFTAPRFFGSGLPFLGSNEEENWTVEKVGKVGEDVSETFLRKCEP